jgi:hypothetical protein
MLHERDTPALMHHQVMSRAPSDYLGELCDWNEDTFDEHWEAVDCFLADVDDAAALAAALGWCGSLNTDTQAAGLDVLGVMAERDSQLLPTLLAQVEAAADSPDDDVRWSAAVSLGRKEDERVLPLLFRFLSDPDPDVRYQAVASLPLLTGDELPVGHPVVGALLGALEDPSPFVRDWAAFGVGVQLDVDTPAIRDALVRHLRETEADTAGEAAVGLARRKDARVFDVLIERLGDFEVGNLYVEAAAALGDPRLLPLLHRLKTSGWQDDEPRPGVLDDAIAQCSGADDAAS